MKNAKKLLAVACILVLCLGLFAGCAGEPAATTPVETEPVETELRSQTLPEDLDFKGENVTILSRDSTFVSDEMWQRGVRVISGNDFFAESVAEGTIGYMLTALRDIPMYCTRLKREKAWKTSEDTNRGLLGKTIGIVSYGAIARHLVRMLQPFRVKIKVYDIKPLPEDHKEKYGLDTDITVYTGPVIGAHSGPGTLALFFMGKER